VSPHFGGEDGGVTMAARKNDPVRVLRVKKGESLKSINAKLREALTAADLQRYTEIDEGVPMEKVIADLRAIQRDETQKRKMKRA
jgi:hypothetical protein